MDANRLCRVGDVVDECFCLDGLVRPTRDDLASACLRAVTEALERFQHGLFTERLHHVAQPPDADAPERARLRLEVAEHQLRCTGVGAQELDNLPVQRSPVHELHRQHGEPLAEQVARQSVARPWRLAANVHLVPHARAERDDLPVRKDGHHHHHVVRVGTAGVVRVIRQEAVALVHIGDVVELQNASHAVGVRAEVRRQRRELPDHIALVVGYTRGEVVRLADDGRVACAEDSGLHLTHDAVQPRPDNFLSDDVRRHFPTLLIRRWLSAERGCVPQSTGNVCARAVGCQTAKREA